MTVRSVMCLRLVFLAILLLLHKHVPVDAASDGDVSLAAKVPDTNSNSNDPIVPINLTSSSSLSAATASSSNPVQPNSNAQAAQTAQQTQQAQTQTMPNSANAANAMQTNHGIQVTSPTMSADKKKKQRASPTDDKKGVESPHQHTHLAVIFGSDLRLLTFFGALFTVIVVIGVVCGVVREYKYKSLDRYEPVGP